MLFTRCAAIVVVLLVSGARLAAEVAPIQTQAPEFGDRTLSMPAIDQDEPDSTNAGTSLNALLLSSYADVDADPIGAAILPASSANGVWQYTTTYVGATSVWATIAVTTGQALRLSGASPANGGVRFVPNAGFSGTATGLQMHAWDASDGFTSGATGPLGATGAATAYSDLTATVDIAVAAAAVNSAPVLAAGAFVLPTTSFAARDGDAGAQISTLVGGAISDADSGAVEGIAVIAADSSQGTWQYRTAGGGPWTTLTPVSVAAARLLPDGARVRFYPSSSFVGTPDLQFRAWDQTAGTAYATLDASNPGGTGPFSAVAELIEATVVANSAAVDEPALVRSGSRSSFYNAICPSTSAGESSVLAELARVGSRNARAFIWDSAAQAYSELPAASAALTEQSGVFLATRSAMSLDFDGLAQDLATFAIELRPGWTFFGVPPLDDGTSALLSHPWANFELRTSPGNVVVDSASTPTFSAVINATPAWWDPVAGAYVNQTTLVTGRGYWIRNNHTATYTLRRLTVPAARIDVAAAAVASDAPPAPPASSAGSDDDGGGCGRGGLGGIVAASVLLLLRLRRARG
ncbi:MAG TPA: hypothetical protein VEL07_14945 [Planctomycetota bacterium]|nr:hypothetical protein [Planctomycetota bacterium]